MARKAKKSTENIEAQAFNPATVNTTPTVTPKLIVAKRSYGRWYVFLAKTPPAENHPCACKTAKSAMRYMHLLKARYGATISQNIYERLQFEAQREG